MYGNYRHLKSDANAKIELLRENLYILISQHGINSKEVLKCSEELDRLIYDFKSDMFIKKTSSDNL